MIICLPMYSSGQKAHFNQLYSFAVNGSGFAGDITSQHPGLELTFSLNRERSLDSAIEFRKKTYRLLTPNSVLVYNPEEPHREIFYREGQSFEAFVFTCEALRSTMGRSFDTFNYVFEHARILDEDFHRQVTSLYRVLRNSSTDSWTSRGISEGFLVSLFSKLGDANLKRQIPNAVALDLAAYFIAGFQDPNCWLGDAEEEFGVSRFHLIRSFKSRFNKTPHRFLTDLRIQYAAECLRGGYAKVIDIAQQSGFEDLSTFNKCFKRHFGCSPREFKRLSS